MCTKHRSKYIKINSLPWFVLEYLHIRFPFLVRKASQTSVRQMAENDLKEGTEEGKDEIEALRHKKMN